MYWLKEGERPRSGPRNRSDSAAPFWRTVNRAEPPASRRRFAGMVPHPQIRHMEKTRVLYNADCPVCRFEIHHYRDYAEGGELDIAFEDLNTADLARWNLDADTAARRLYVLDGEEMTSGIPAFLVLWSRMPRYRWLARLVGLPVIRPRLQLSL